MNSKTFTSEWKATVAQPDFREQMLYELIARFGGCVEERDGGGVYGTVSFADSTAVSVTSDLLEIVDLSNGFDVVESITA